MEKVHTAVMWDFDWSMIDENSDPFIVKFFADKEMQSLFDKDFKTGLPWLEVMVIP